MGKGGRWNLLLGLTEYHVRLDNWGKHQDYVMRQLQEYLDEGWQFISPPGPNSYRYIHHEGYAGGVTYTWLELSSFVVDLRRPARPRTEKERQVLGVWQEAKDPNRGLGKLINLISVQRLTSDRWRYEFRKDRTFRRTDGNGKRRDGGIFLENDEGEIKIFYKYSPRLDGVVTVEDNRLIMPNSRWVFERVSQ
jgi:hypothetical protein